MGLGYLNSDGTVDLIVSLRYDATAAAPSLARWECMLDEASKLLHQATGGLARLGKVWFANNLAGSKAADLCAFNTDTGWDAPAQTTCQGNFDHHFGTPGQAIVAGAAGVNSPYLMLHELGHYAFALMDEADAAVRRCTNDQFAPGCIMEFRTAGFGASVDAQCSVTTPQFTNKTRFCTPVGVNHPQSGAPLPEEHGPDPLNPQHDCHGASCVQTIQAFTTELGHPIVIPVPAEDPANAAPPIDWIELDRTPRFVLVLDRSFSMLANRAFAGVRHAANYWIDLEAAFGRPNDFAIVTYNHAATRTWPRAGLPMQNLVPAHVANAKLFVQEDVQPAGSTDVAGALAFAKNLIAPPANPLDLAATQAIVLVSDGRQTEPGDPLQEVADLRRKFIRVFAIGMGPDPDIAKPVLQQIADGTKGWCEQVDVVPPGQAEVGMKGGLIDPMIFASADLHSGLVLVEEAVLQAEAGGEQEYAFTVEEGAEAATVVVRRPAGVAVDLAVIAPDDEEPVDPEQYDARRIGFANPPGAPYALAVANAPAPGEWRVRVTTAGDDAPVRVVAFVSNEDIIVGLLGRQGVHGVRDAPRLVARVIYGGTVTGLTTAVVRNPEGEQVAAFTEHEPGSGTYVAELPPREPGSYEYFAELANDGTAVLVRPHDADPAKPPPAVGVPPFTRLERVLIEVTQPPGGAAS